MLRNETRLLRVPVAESDPVADPYIVAIMTELQGGGAFSLATMKAKAGPVKFASRRIELLRKSR